MMLLSCNGPAAARSLSQVCRRTTPRSSLRVTTAGTTKNLNRRGFSSSAFKGGSPSSLAAPVIAASGLAAVIACRQWGNLDSDTVLCDSGKGAEVVMYGPTAEPATGILFPRLCNGMTFVGCGVRVKYRFVKVYAVGTYVDPIAMDYVKRQGDGEIKIALLDPKYPRTIRVVMNRALSIDKYTAAIVEALEPRMNGQDLDKLDEFKKLNPQGDLVEGAVMEMTVRGNELLYRNSAGTVGAIHSEVFCRALCDVYYGDDAVSPPHKDDVIEGIKAL